jgi:replicative DNA helicase
VNQNEAHFAPAEDLEALQAAVIAAAVAGDETCRGELPGLHAGFEEPYRTVAAALMDQLLGGGFADEHTLRAALEGRRLHRRNTDGRVEELSARQAVDLVCAGVPQPAKAAAYLPLLKQQLQAKRRAESKERALELVKEFDGDLNKLHHEVGALAAQARFDGGGHPSEAMLFFPYFQQLVGLQKGREFLGLDSGFTHLNRVANGLDAGLSVLAARPSAGKTTFAWQCCQQVAEINKAPAIFVSMEQSARELRAKALARFSRLDSRHISRGGLRSDDPEDLKRLQAAAERYFNVARYLTIVEGDDTTTVEGIGELAAAKMARAGAHRCFVVLDYLQILPLQRADAGRVTSPKDRVDLHVSALRRLARQLDSPVLAISSENRQGYTSTSLDVFKESGGIEYSADIAAVMTIDTEGTRAAGGKHRVVDLNVVKNRNGGLAVVKFKFHPERAEFIELERCERTDADED